MAKDPLCESSTNASKKPNCQQDDATMTGLVIRFRNGSDVTATKARRISRFRRNASLMHAPNASEYISKRNLARIRIISRPRRRHWARPNKRSSFCFLFFSPFFITTSSLPSPPLPSPSHRSASRNVQRETRCRGRGGIADSHREPNVCPPSPSPSLTSGPCLP